MALQSFILHSENSQALLLPWGISNATKKTPATDLSRLRVCLGQHYMYLWLFLKHNLYFHSNTPKSWYQYDLIRVSLADKTEKQTRMTITSTKIKNKYKSRQTKKKSTTLTKQRKVGRKSFTITNGCLYSKEVRTRTKQDLYFNFSY